VTAPLAGDYEVRVGSIIQAGTSALTHGLHSFDVGATTALDVDAAQYVASTALHRAAVTARRLKTGLSAGDDVVSMYKSATANSVTFGSRWISIVPIRVGRA
jgi:hypothetical protein